MKKSLAVVCSLAGLTLGGCATQSVHLQNTRIEGPLNVPPLFIVEEEEKIGTWRLSMGASVAPDQRIEGRAAGHSKVNAAGIYQVDTVVNGGQVTYIERRSVNTHDFEGTNFWWNLTRFTASLQADYRVARGLSMVGGFHYSRRGSQSYLGGVLGIGFSFHSRNIGVRLDIGGVWTEVSYDIEYVVTNTPFTLNPPETYVLFFSERGKSGNANMYGAFTLNTRYPTWPIQLFVQLAIYRQTVADVERRAFHDINAVVLQHNSFFAVTPGLSVPLSSSSRFMLGVRLTDETALLVGEPGVLVAPFACIEFTL
ncbi:MAG TPA: hypothetical protein VNL69_05070 [Bacteroidota bacterium]|nr:hypothetical protein [Bacteroidota bacterium]